MSVDRLEDEKISDWMARDIVINMETLPIKDAVAKTFSEIENDPKDYWRISVTLLDGVIKVKTFKDVDYTFNKLIKND